MYPSDVVDKLVLQHSCVESAVSQTYDNWFCGQVRIHDIKRACGGSADERHLHPTIRECSLPHVWTIDPP